MRRFAGRRCAVLSAVGVCGLALAAPANAAPLPVLGPLDQSADLMGAVTSGGLPGETWAYRQLPLDVPPPVFGGQALAYGAVSNPIKPDPQLAFLRYTDSGGWQVAQTPVDRTGAPWRGVVPNPAAATVLPRGGGFLIGRDSGAPLAEQATLLVRDPGGSFREVQPPPPTVAHPAGDPNPDDPAETLAGDRGLGAVAAGGYEVAQGTRVLVAPQGRAVEDGILFYDGTGWSREPITLPSPAPSRFHVIAIGATAPDNAWMLADVALPEVGPIGGADQPGVVVYRRTPGAGGAHWEPQQLGSGLFSARATPTRGVADLGALGGGMQQALTVTSSGVWIDGSLAGVPGGTAQDFTLYFDIAGARVTHSWCDALDASGALLCDSPLQFAFSRRTGYRSIAFPGAGFGGRIVSNPVDPGGDDTSNGGTYMRLDGAAFTRLPAGNGNQRATAAFATPSSGWLEGPVQISPATAPTYLKSVPVALRSPLTAVAAEPSKPRGGTGSGALAVGASGAVARFVPGQGWTREFLLTSAGAVSSPTLRGVAWPEPGRAYAVGDVGSMWLWRAETGLWERDAGAPIGFDGNLLGVAFAPGSDTRGYAVGRSGTLLRYDKTWTQEQLPAAVSATDLTSIAFAGSQAIVAAGGDLLVNEGGAWHVDEQAHALLASVPGGQARLLAVAGLADGGAVAAGRDFVMERDGATAPWRFADQPLPGATVVAAGAFRDGARVRALVSVIPRLPYPPSEDLPPPDPNVPPVILPPTPLPGDGYVLRETGTGWRDEQRTAFNGAGPDRPLKSDPIAAFDVGQDGLGWAVGGWSGEADSAGRGSSARNSIGRNIRLRVQTGGIYRYGPADAATGTGGLGSALVPLSSGLATFAVAGHGQCEQRCAQLAGQQVAPDRMIDATLARASALAARADGPRFLLYTGGRTRPTGAGQPASEAERYASLLGAPDGLAVYPAVSAGDSDGPAGAAAFSAAFAGFAAPLGSAAAPGAITPLTPPGAAARTHYAFDSAGAAGSVRVIVIDNSRGSLAASDPYQSPHEAQAPWLAAQLASARAQAIPAVVMGSRDLNANFAPKLNVADDAQAIARVLVEGGASAYFFERPEENRAESISGGTGTTIPEFGTGTLGYRSPLSNTTQPGQPDALFGDAGFLLAQVDVAHRDAATNRAPVSARLVPLIDDLALQAVDGILLRRSRPALFQGLGRRPLAGDRWGEVGSDGNPNPPGGDPYTAFPPEQCTGASCPSRVVPEFTFHSSDPDIADFVAQDPTSTNLRKPFISPHDAVVTDARSGLLCPFNAGTTTVTIRAGGLSYAQKLTVLDGSVQRPCGTRPLDPSRFKITTVVPVTAPGPAPAPAGAPAVPPPNPLTVVKAVPKPARLPPPSLPDQLLPTLTAPGASILAALPPPTAAFARPIPPGGATVRAFEEKREEEAAPEQSQAFATYRRPEEFQMAPYLYGVIVLAAFAGAAARAGSRRRRQRAPAYAHMHGAPPSELLIDPDRRPRPRRS